MNASTTTATTPLAITRQPLQLDEIRENQYKKDRLTAQLRQVVTKEYPSGKAGNSLNDNMFATEDFAFKAKPASSTRMAFIDVPLGTTAEAFAQKLAQFPNAGIQLILSDEVILTKEQEQAIANNLTTIDVIKYGVNGTNGQLIRYGQNTDGNDPMAFIPGPNGAPQFKVTAFRTDVTAQDALDIDLRTPKAVVNGYQVPAVAQVETPRAFSVTGVPAPQPAQVAVTADEDDSDF